MTRARAPTLHTVARAAGVSTAIVSRVVNGHYHGMSAVTRARVEAAVDKLGYFPNRAARSLRTSRHHRIALIAVDSSPEFLADPFTTYVVAGLSNALSEQDYGLLVQRLNRRAPIETLLMRAQDADAVTLFMSGPESERLALIDRFRQLGLPLLVFQEQLSPVPDDICVVRQDDRAGGRWLGERIRGQGLSDVLAVVPELTWPAIEARLAGLRDGLADRAGPTVLKVAETDMQAVSAALDRQLRAHVPEAIFASNDQLAAQSIGALARIGRQVPQDVRVSGFNALPITGSVHPPLTTVRSPAFALGTRAADLLVQRLADGRFATKELVLPVEPHAGLSL
ncbi:MAG: LacI family DNA-binding transcriptional regulator [Geminicoccaceae bacterium]